MTVQRFYLTTCSKLYLFKLVLYNTRFELQLAMETHGWNYKQTYMYTLKSMLGTPVSFVFVFFFNFETD